MPAHPLTALTCLITMLALIGCAHDTPAAPPDTRILAIDMQRLAAGDLRQNVVIRDGDVIRVSESTLYEPSQLSSLRETDYRASQWVLRAGDRVDVAIYELETPGVEYIQAVRIDANGDLRPYKIGPIRAAGLTTYELADAISHKLEADGTLRHATVSVYLRSGYGTFSVEGVPLASTGPMPPGTCALASTDTRLLSALKQSGGLPESYTHLYVLRPQPEPGFRPLPGPLSDHPIGKHTSRFSVKERAQGEEPGQVQEAAATPLFFRTSDELPDHQPDAVLSVNGTGLRVGLDTGAGMPVALFDNAARLLGLETRPDESDRFRWATATFDADRDGTPSPPTDVRIFPAPPGAQVAGIIGWPTLKQSVWVLDYPQRRHTRHDELPVEIAERWQSFPIVSVPGHVLAIEVADGEDTHTVKIDTGSTGGVYLSDTRWRAWVEDHPDAWTTLKAIYSPAIENGFLALQVAYPDDYVLGDLWLGVVALSPAFAQVNIAGQNMANDTSTIGVGALRNRAMCIDGPGGRVYFGPRVEPHANDTACGINLAQATFIPTSQDDGPMAAHVIEGGVAYQAGLRDGDLLLEVDGMDASQWRTDPRIRPSQFLQAPAGSTLHLLIMRDGEDIAIDIRLEALHEDD
ncbi:MAG: polysaccharide biosynthesis/export family protein [Phycisphaerales bacterium JB063]